MSYGSSTDIAIIINELHTAAQLYLERIFNMVQEKKNALTKRSSAMVQHLSRTFRFLQKKLSSLVRRLKNMRRNQTDRLMNIDLILVLSLNLASIGK